MVRQIALYNNITCWEETTMNTAKTIVLVEKVAFKLCGKYNPLYWLLKVTVGLNTFARLQVAINHAEEEDNKEVLDELRDAWEGLNGNIAKQAAVLAVSICAMLFCGSGIDPQDPMSGNITIIAGFYIGAWYVITFASVKKMFVSDATITTFFMFFVFTTAKGLLFVQAQSMSDPRVTLVVQTMLVAGWITSAIYDNMDFLKNGLDDLAMTFYKESLKKLGGLS